MPEDLFLPVRKVVTETQGVTLQKLFMQCADAQSAGVVELTLAPLNEAGEWASGVMPLVVRREDALLSSDPTQRTAGSVVQQLVFSAICTGPQAQALGVLGLSIWDAAKIIVASQVGGDETGDGGGGEG